MIKYIDLSGGKKKFMIKESTHKRSNWLVVRTIELRKNKKDSHTGNWTRAFWVKARYPNH